MTIAIKNINPSYINEVENTAAVVGGLAIEKYVGAPDTTTSVVITPIGGNPDNILAALELSIDYASRNGFVSEVLHGGSFGFVATKALFFDLSIL